MLTIMITARNAAATIERAVRSALAENLPILLVDDRCTDDTVARAQAAGGPNLRVIAAKAPGSLPVARQTGLEAVTTPYAAWLDADDEWVAGRAERLVAALQQGVDVVADGIELYDGRTGQLLRRMSAPPFLQREITPVRLFERNYLAGDTQVGFRVATLRAAGGYDPAVYGPESFDLLLRAIARGATFAWLPQTGYRMYAYAGSVSRDLPGLRAAGVLALRKHTYDHVRQLCLKAGYTPRVAEWVLVSMALFRDDPEAARSFLDAAAPKSCDPDEVLEPDGPLPLPEGWRRAFFRGTIDLLLRASSAKAARDLQMAEDRQPSAETANNLGVAHRRLGQESQARALFTEALRRFPEYLDARQNLSASEAECITTHPFRRHAVRFEY